MIANEAPESLLPGLADLLLDYDNVRRVRVGVRAGRGVMDVRMTNYMHLNEYPFFFRLREDRTQQFSSVRHAHQGVEMLYVHEGFGRISIERQSFIVRPGTLFIFKPYQLHQVQMFTSPRQPYVRTLLLFEPAALDKYLAAFPSLRQLLGSMLHERTAPMVFGELEPSSLDALFQLYQGCFRPMSSADVMEHQAMLLISMLCMLKTAWDTATSPLSPVEQMIRWIEHHYMEPFELKKLAQAVHLSPAYVSYLFKKQVGSSITDYLKKVRIRQACWLLKTSDLSVGEVGEAVGLTNESYFCQLFKTETGTSPYRYKKDAENNPPFVPFK